MLDAGCGWGGSSLWLANFRSAIVTGISPFVEQIEKCTIKAEKLKLSHKANFVLADYRKTGFPDNTFDVVWAIESICHADDKFDFYKEAFRVLKPRGRLVVAEYILQKKNFSKKEKRILSSWLCNHAIPRIDNEDEHLHNLRKSGFLNFKIEDYTSQVRVSVRNLHEKSTRCFPIEFFLRIFGFRSAIQL